MNTHASPIAATQPPLKLVAMLVALGLLIPLAACRDRGQAAQGELGADADLIVDADEDTPLPDSGADDVATDVEDASGADGAADTDEPPPIDRSDPCPTPTPPPEALLRPGLNEDGTVLTPTGRSLTPEGLHVDLASGFTSDMRVDPLGQVAWVSVTGTRDTRLLVVNLDTGEISQQIDRGNSFYGMAVSPDGTRLYASGGFGGVVDVFEIGEGGALTGPTASIETGGIPSGMALSQDGGLLWVGLFNTGSVLEIDTVTLSEVRRVELPLRVWDVVHLPARGELYASDIGGEGIAVVELNSGEVVAEIAAPTAPAGMVASSRGDRVWAAVSGGDVVMAIDTERRAVVAQSAVAEADLTNEEGLPLPNSNVNALALDEVAGRLYATRGADNAVSVFDSADLRLLGAVPTSWYPTSLALTGDASRLAVVEGKGSGIGPNEGTSAKHRVTSSMTVVDLNGLDLTASTARVIENTNRPALTFPFECDGFFPIPTTDEAERRSPIEHVILVVKENKTFDCVFGDLDDRDVDIDPELVRWGEDITPNQHALARAFNVSDNFYTEVTNSDTGHLLLTNTHLPEYVERVWIEKVRNDLFQGFQGRPESVPDVGNFFTHLLDEGIDIRIYGEIVGMFATSPENPAQTPFAYSDSDYPGGPFVNYNARDEDKARYVADRIHEGDLASFTYILLPNDHTVGTTPGEPTPESMVADNDYAVGLLVDALSKSPLWEKSALFIVQDDPQGCADHVDATRSFLLVISPWARRDYVSHAHASFMSVFATIERILGVPPLGRSDASASPLWDLFTAEPDLTPYDALERIIPEANNNKDAIGADRSKKMNFSSPDRNPALRVVLDAHRRHQMGWISREEAEAMVRAPRRAVDEETWEELEEESEEESTAFDLDWERYKSWLKARGEPTPSWRFMQNTDTDKDGIKDPQSD